MEAAMKLAAEREEARRKQDREDEEAARQPLLNDTSFDRRRVVAVYKDDGSRGHHMQVLHQLHCRLQIGQVAVMQQQ